jgi:hypothetical protein
MDEVDISKQVSMALDTEIENVEKELAEKYGAVKNDVASYAQVEVVKDALSDESKDKEEKYEEISMPTTAPSQIEIPTGPIKRTKAELIADILELQEKLQLSEFNSVSLTRMKKSQLELVLTGFVERGTMRMAGMSKEKEQKAELAGSNAELLFDMNVILCTLAGEISGIDRITKYTKGVNCLEGWDKMVEKQRNILIPIITKIYMKNEVVIDKYMSPLHQWGMHMFCSAAITTAINLKKKQTNSNGNSCITEL